MPLIWKLIPWKSWCFGSWGKWSQGQGHVPRVSKHWLSCYLLTPCLILQILQLEDSWSTLSWSFSIPDSNWRNSRKHARGPWCPWTSRWKRYPNGIFVLISCTVEIQEQKQKITGKNLGKYRQCLIIYNLRQSATCPVLWVPD